MEYHFSRLPGRKSLAHLLESLPGHTGRGLLVLFFWEPTLEGQNRGFAYVPLLTYPDIAVQFSAIHKFPQHGHWSYPSNRRSFPSYPRLLEYRNLIRDRPSSHQLCADRIASLSLVAWDR